MRKLCAAILSFTTREQRRPMSAWARWRPRLVRPGSPPVPTQPRPRAHRAPRAGVADCTDLQVFRGADAGTRTPDPLLYHGEHGTALRDGATPLGKRDGSGSGTADAGSAMRLDPGGFRRFRPQIAFLGSRARLRSWAPLKDLHRTGGRARHSRSLPPEQRRSAGQTFRGHRPRASL